MLKKLYVVIVVAMVAMMAALPAMAGMSGSGQSGINVQNLSTTSSATVYVNLYNQTDGSSVTISGASGDTINSKASKNYYLPSISGLSDGAYSMVASSTQPIAAIARTDWSATGGAALYSSVAPGKDVTIPLAVWNYAGQTSKFSVQNTNTSAQITDVQIQLFGIGSATPVKTLTNQTIKAGSSNTYDLGDTAVFGTLTPNGAPLGVPAGFVGSLRITSATDLVVQSFIDLAGVRAVSAFVGVPTSSAAGTLYCPLIRANYYGDTGISLVNPNGFPVEATISFYSDANSPQKPADLSTPIATEHVTVPANSSALSFQGVGGSSRVQGLPAGGNNSPKPNNLGYYGVAKITTTASGGTPTLMAVVNDTLFNASWGVESQSSYNCTGDTEGATSFALPLVRKYHLSTTKLTTGIQIQNLTGSEVTVTLELFNGWNGAAATGPGAGTVTIPPYGSGNYWNGNLTGLETVPPAYGGYGWFGSAILTATGNVAVVVSDEGYGSTKVDSANYNALAMP